MSEAQKAELTADQVERLIEATYTNVGVFVRDTEVAPELSAKYQPGLIFREKGLTYSSFRVGGQTANVRYVIFSNHLIKKYPDPENYGLCLAGKGAVFKVLGRHDSDGRSFIILLHLPDEDYWKYFQDYESPVDQDMVKSCLDWLNVMAEKPPIPELTAEEWVDSCKYPMGIDDNGEFFPL
ncbi:MAG: hypothetical protein LBP22_00115 [Deltaproteobacteria bacterium]|nr:hypothetical protein [Deltaproteobacteria bacterium]